MDDGGKLGSTLFGGRGRTKSHRPQVTGQCLPTSGSFMHLFIVFFFDTHLQVMLFDPSPTGNGFIASTQSLSSCQSMSCPWDGDIVWCGSSGTILGCMLGWCGLSGRHRSQVKGHRFATSGLWHLCVSLCSAIHLQLSKGALPLPTTKGSF